MLRRYYETPGPATHFFLLKYLPYALGQALPIWKAQPNEQDAAMRSWSESSTVGEIEILCYQESLVALRRFPNLAVTPAT